MNSNTLDQRSKRLRFGLGWRLARIHAERCAALLAILRTPGLCRSRPSWRSAYIAAIRL